jgi:hypothetical protein
MGCFAQGCLAVVIAGFVLVAVGGGGGWYLYNKAINVFTSAQAANIQVEQPSEIAFQAAEGRLNRLRDATSHNRETTIEFTSADLNALIARDPGFAGLRGKGHMTIADSVVTLQLSAPLDSAPFPKLKNRWFNGTARFGFAYTLGQFVFAAKSAEANGHQLPDAFFTSFTPSFNRSFNDSFQRASREHPQSAAFWKRIKGMTVQNDKLIVVTQQTENN